MEAAAEEQDLDHHDTMQTLMARHQFHQVKLEQVMRALENDQARTSSLFQTIFSYINTPLRCHMLLSLPEATSDTGLSNQLQSHDCARKHCLAVRLQLCLQTDKLQRLQIVQRHALSVYLVLASCTGSA